MSITLIEVMVFWCVHISKHIQAYFQTHPIVQVKYVQFLVYRLHLNKVGVFFFLRINLGRTWEVSVLSLQLFSKSKIIPNEFYLLNGALVSSPPEADTETRI